jgi:hypothetical protein
MDDRTQLPDPPHSWDGDSYIEKQCTCYKFDWEPHPCPYQQDIHDDHDPDYCCCCPYCVTQCALDI